MISKFFFFFPYLPSPCLFGAFGVWSRGNIHTCTYDEAIGQRNFLSGTGRLYSEFLVYSLPSFPNNKKDVFVHIEFIGPGKSEIPGDEKGKERCIRSWGLVGYVRLIIGKERFPKIYKAGKIATQKLIYFYAHYNIYILHEWCFISSDRYIYLIIYAHMSTTRAKRPHGFAVTLSSTHTRVPI